MTAASAKTRRFSIKITITNIWNSMGPKIEHCKTPVDKSSESYGAIICNFDSIAEKRVHFFDKRY